MWNIWLPSWYQSASHVVNVIFSRKSCIFCFFVACWSLHSILFLWKNWQYLCFVCQGHISLDSLPRRGYHIPAKGTVQVVHSVTCDLVHISATLVYLLVVQSSKFKAKQRKNCATESWLISRIYWMLESSIAKMKKGGMWKCVFQSEWFNQYKHFFLF